MLFAFLGLVWSRTDLFGHNDVILDPHMHATPPGITGSAPTGLGRPQNSDSACLLASGIPRHHYPVVGVVWGWLVSPLGACMGDNDVIVICSRGTVNADGRRFYQKCSFVISYPFSEGRGVPGFVFQAEAEELNLLINL